MIEIAFENSVWFLFRMKGQWNQRLFMTEGIVDYYYIIHAIEHSRRETALP